jgi:hypothetical protein
VSPRRRTRAAASVALTAKGLPPADHTRTGCESLHCTSGQALRRPRPREAGVYTRSPTRDRGTTQRPGDSRGCQFGGGGRRRREEMKESDSPRLPVVLILTIDYPPWERETPSSTKGTINLCQLTGTKPQGMIRTIGSGSTERTNLPPRRFHHVSDDSQNGHRRVGRNDAGGSPAGTEDPVQVVLSGRPMNEQRIRERIRARLGSGQLRAEDSTFVVARRTAARRVRPAGRPIESADAAPYGHRYLDGEHHWLHRRCIVLWADEDTDCAVARLREDTCFKPTRPGDFRGQHISKSS